MTKYPIEAGRALAGQVAKELETYLVERRIERAEALLFVNRHLVYDALLEFAEKGRPLSHGDLEADAADYQARELFRDHCQPGSRGTLERYGEKAAVAAIIEATAEAHEALQEISDAHLGDQPASDDGSEYEWAVRHIRHLRGIARAALAIAPTPEPKP